jgi:hypothetical protein
LDLIKVPLPRGARVDDGWLRTATLRPLSDDDGTFLAVDARSLAPFDGTTMLLERCLVESPEADVERTHLPLLTMGDREALLLSLYRASFGSNIPAILACPGCKESLEFDLAIQDVLQPTVSRPAGSLERVVDYDGRRYLCTVRAPAAADIEAVLSLAATESPYQAASELFERCVVAVDADTQLAVEHPARELSDLLDEAFDELDPQAETLLKLRCVACGLHFEACLDAGEVLMRTARRKSHEMFEQVHRLALHYHWGESEILAMSPARRAVYLDLLGEGPVGGT